MSFICRFPGVFHSSWPHTYTQKHTQQGCSPSSRCRIRAVEFINWKSDASLLSGNWRGRPKQSSQSTTALSIVFLFTQSLPKAPRDSKAICNSSRTVAPPLVTNQIKSTVDDLRTVHWEWTGTVVEGFRFSSSAAHDRPRRERKPFGTRLTCDVTAACRRGEFPLLRASQQTKQEWFCWAPFSKRKDQFCMMHIYWFIITKSPVLCISGLALLF